MTVKIKIYTTPHCMKCKVTIRELTKRNLIEGRDFEVLSVNDRPDELMIEEYKTAPVVGVYSDGECIDSWSNYRFDKIRSVVKDYYEVDPAHVSV